MSLARSIALLSVSCCFLPTPVFAQAGEVFRDMGNGWRILIADADTCQAMKQVDGGAMMLFDVTKETGKPLSTSLALGNPAWKSFKYGAGYPVEVTYDRQKPLAITAFGSEAGGMGLLFIPADDPTNFARQFARFNQMDVTFKGKPVFRTSLKGSARAFREAERCVDAQVAKAAEQAVATSDPFAEETAPAPQAAADQGAGSGAAPAPDADNPFAEATPAAPKAAADQGTGSGAAPSAADTAATTGGADPATPPAPETETALATPKAEPTPAAPAASGGTGTPGEGVVAECDALAAHPDDPGRPSDVAGFLESKMDGPKAVTACEAAVAAEPGNPRLKYELGRAYSAAGDKDKAFKALTEASAAGYGFADVSLAIAHENGEGTPADPQKARATVKKAADAGLAAGKYGLGRLMIQGIGGPADAEAAVALWRDAAEAGVKNAQYSLGLVFENGMGVPADPAESFKYYKMAAEGGNADAALKTGLALMRGSGTDLDMSQGFSFVSRSADLGSPLGAATLGMFYENGLGVDKNADQAAAMYRKVAASPDATEETKALATEGLKRLGVN